MDEDLKKQVTLGVALAFVVAVCVALGVVTHYHSTPGKVSENSLFERIPNEIFLGKRATKLSDFHSGQTHPLAWAKKKKNLDLGFALHRAVLYRYQDPPKIFSNL